MLASLAFLHNITQWGEDCSLPASAVNISNGTYYVVGTAVLWSWTLLASSIIPSQLFWHIQYPALDDISLATTFKTGSLTNLGSKTHDPFSWLLDPFDLWSLSELFAFALGQLRSCEQMHFPQVSRCSRSPWTWFVSHGYLHCINIITQKAFMFCTIMQPCQPIAGWVLC